jgi:hypothetical protein
MIQTLFDIFVGGVFWIVDNPIPELGIIWITLKSY